MKKHGIILTTVAALVAGYVVAAFCPGGEPRGVKFENLNIRVIKNRDTHRYKITEDSPLFAYELAEVAYPESMLNWKETEELAVAVARAIAVHLGSTNDLRLVHWVQPEPASTNIVDVILAKLHGQYETERVIPLEKKRESK